VVPDVVDESFSDAKLLLEQDKFVVAPAVKMVSSSAPGTVLSQTPSAGKAPQGSTVTLTIAKAPPNVSVPNLVGDTAYAASARLGELGLVPKVVMEQRATNPQYNNEVLSQSPPRGNSVAPGTTVIIRVEAYVAPSTGPTGPTGPGGTGATS
jgi:serine/threonine-protein kinase